MMRRGLVIAPVLLAVGSPLAAQDFEKVGTRAPVSPTGIPYTVPAAARAAGWTIAAPQARLGLSGSNPAFLGTAAGSATPANTTRWEAAIEGLYQAAEKSAKATGLSSAEPWFVVRLARFGVRLYLATMCYLCC